MAKVLSDGVYDSSAVIDFLERYGIEVAVMPRGNSRPDKGSPGRRRAVELARRLGYEGLAKLTGYGGVGR